MEILRVLDKLDFRTFMKNMNDDIKPGVHDKVIHVYKYPDASVDNTVIMIFIKENDKYNLTMCIVDGSRFDLNTINTLILMMGLNRFVERGDVYLNMYRYISINDMNINFTIETEKHYSDIVYNLNCFIRSDNDFVHRYLTESATYDRDVYNVLDEASVNHVRAILQADTNKIKYPLFVRMNYGNDMVAIVHSNSIACRSLVMIYTDINDFIGSDYMYSELLNIMTSQIDVNDERKWHGYKTQEHFYSDEQPWLTANIIIDMITKLEISKGK